MNIVYGALMSLIGLAMLYGSTLNREFAIYRLLVARSRLFWGSGPAVHRMYQVSGMILMILGIFWCLGIIWTDGS